MNGKERRDNVQTQGAPGGSGASWEAFVSGDFGCGFLHWIVASRKKTPRPSLSLRMLNYVCM